MFQKLRNAPLIMAFIVVLGLVTVTFPWHRLIALVFVAICALLIAIIWRLIRSVDPSERNMVEAITGTLTSIAILSAGYWYVFERPGVPKVDLSAETKAWPVKGNKLWLSTTVKIRNVGSTAIHFEPEQKLKVFIGQVMPATGNTFDSLTAHADQRIADGKKSMSMVDDPNWPKRASITYQLEEKAERNRSAEESEEDNSKSTIIEAGEEEQFDFKAMIACEDNMILATMAKLDKPTVLMDRMMGRSTDNFVWLTQSIGEEVAPCLE